MHKFKNNLKNKKNSINKVTKRIKKEPLKVKQILDLDDFQVLDLVRDEKEKNNKDLYDFVKCTDEQDNKKTVNDKTVKKATTNKMKMHIDKRMKDKHQVTVNRPYTVCTRSNKSIKTVTNVEQKESNRQMNGLNAMQKFMQEANEVEKQINRYIKKYGAYLPSRM